jgi:hypothetical protein
VAIFSFPTSPTNPFETASFELSRNVSINRLASGQTQVREVGRPRWTATYTTVPLLAEQAAQWKAFWDSLQGGLNRFTAYDPDQQRPASSLPAGAVPTAATVASKGTNTVSLSGLPSGYVLSAGDMFSEVEGSKRALYRIITPATGSSVTVQVEPIPNANQMVNPSGNAVEFFRPICIMVPVPGSWSYEARGGTLSPAKFSGVEVLY